MPDIMMLLSCLGYCLEPTTLRRLTKIVEALLSVVGRVTILGISRWSEPGGRYRTVQRFFTTAVNWDKVQWLIIAQHLLDEQDVLLLAGDEVVVTKSGKKTHDLDRFFSSLYGKAIPGICFSSLSLISVKRRCSSPTRALTRDEGGAENMTTSSNIAVFPINTSRRALLARVFRPLFIRCACGTNDLLID
ncbi:MAG: transposase [Gammaproteobacteria bacterium]|nr:transposase [Gammaproteobacteria bacterium]